MATAMATARRAKRSNFKKASTSLAQNRFGPSAAQQRQYQDQATQAASQGLAPAAQQVAQANLGGPQIPTAAASPADIAARSVGLQQQAIGATAAWRDKMALQQEARANELVEKEVAERKARRAKLLSIGASLALPATGAGGVVTKALQAFANQQPVGSTKRNVLGGLSNYAGQLGDMYDPRRRQRSGEQS